MMFSLKPSRNFDCHTHRQQAAAGRALINVSDECLLHPHLFMPQEGAFYSVGIHPMFHDSLEQATVSFQQLLHHRQIVAVGECGFDRRSHLSLQQQEELFRFQLECAQRFSMPVVVHCVGGWDRLLRLQKSVPALERRIVHGFRGKPELARQLLSAGFSLSFGPRLNSESLALCPKDRRFVETDNFNITLEEVCRLQDNFYDA